MLRDLEVKLLFQSSNQRTAGISIECIECHAPIWEGGGYMYHRTVYIHERDRKAHVCAAYMCYRCDKDWATVLRAEFFAQERWGFYTYGTLRARVLAALRQGFCFTEQEIQLQRWGLPRPVTSLREVEG